MSNKSLKLLFEPNRIERVTTDETLRNKIVSACQAKAKKYDISVMAKKYNDLYKTLG